MADLLIAMVFDPAKVALMVFITGAAIAVVIRGVRRSNANRGDPRWNDHQGQPGYEASAHGAMPRTPLPEWVHWDDEDNR